MALKHPVWRMGAKITVDSASLMNKGIELIEAMLLFGVDSTQIDAVISPGSFIHGMAEFTDGSVKLLGANPDMRLPAMVCLAWPRRLPARIEALDPGGIAPRSILFEPADEDRFPSLRLAREAARRRGPYPVLLVGADEVAVDAFLKHSIGFTQIPQVVERVLEQAPSSPLSSLEEALSVLDEARRLAARAVRGMKRDN
jgi:1-deoxy-D-xylulose-5-phosphate reductoisomerase